VEIKIKLDRDGYASMCLVLDADDELEDIQNSADFIGKIQDVVFFPREKND
jgi:hypothetical protein